MKKSIFHMIPGLLAMGLAVGVNFAQAQTAGSFDTTFGTGGTVTTTFAGQTVVPIGAVQHGRGRDCAGALSGELAGAGGRHRSTRCHSSENPFEQFRRG